MATGGRGSGSPIAVGTVIIRADLSQYNAALATIRRQLTTFRAPGINVSINPASFSRVMAQIAQIRAAMNAIGRGGFGGFGFGGFGFGIGASFPGLGRGIGAAGQGIGKGLGSVGQGFGAGAGALAKGLGQGVGSAAAGLGRGFKSAVGGLSGIAGLGLGLGGIGAGMTVGAGISTSVRSAIAMEASLANIGRLAGYDKTQLNQLRSAFEQISTAKGGAPMEELFAIAGFGARTGLGTEGLQPQGLIDFTKAMAKVHTVIDDIPVEQLASEMAKIQNVFKISSEYSEGLASGLLKLDTMSAATADEILNITQRMSGFAQAVGLTLPQVMALAATMKDVGLPVEAGSTAMMRILTKLDTGGQDMAANLGIPAEDFQQAMSKGPLSGLKLILDALDKIEDKGEKIRTIFGKEGLGLHNMRDIAALTQMGAKMGDVQNRAEIVAGEIVSKESIEKGVAAKAATTEKTLERLKESVLNLMAALGDPLLGPINQLAEAMNSAATRMKDMAKGGGGQAPAKIGMQALFGVGADLVPGMGDKSAPTQVLQLLGKFFQGGMPRFGNLPQAGVAPGGGMLPLGKAPVAMPIGIPKAVPPALQAQGQPRPIRPDFGNPVGVMGQWMLEIGKNLDKKKHDVPGGPLANIGRMLSHGGDMLETIREGKKKFQPMVGGSGLDVGRRVQEDVLEQFAKDKNDPQVRKLEEVKQEVSKVAEKIAAALKGFIVGGPAAME